MDILYIAIPMALGIAAFFVIAFLWSVSNGQLDDLETPAVRMLFDDEPEFGTKSTDKSPSEPHGEPSKPDEAPKNSDA
jgi:cbb3-type cytochrome oxidase maturation protein